MRWASSYLLSHIIPVLARVDASLQRRSPASCVDGGTAVSLALRGHPVDEKRDGILSFWDAIVRRTRCDASGGARDNACRNGDAIKNPAADIDVVRRKVVTFSIIEGEEQRTRWVLRGYLT